MESYIFCLFVSVSLYVCVCVHVCMCTQWLYIPVHVCGEIHMGIWTHAYRYKKSNLGIPTQFSLPCFMRQVVSLAGGWQVRQTGNLVSLQGSVEVTLSTLGF